WFNEAYRVFVHTNGNGYVAETSNYTIRRITPAGAVTTLAGRVGSVGTAEGTGSAARFNQPFSVAIDSAGSMYVADFQNERITKGTALLQFDGAIGVTVSNASFQARLIGLTGSNVVVEASPDLAAWTPFQTNALPV